MAKVVLLLGGNEYGTRSAFSCCLDMLAKKVGKINSVSSLYTSPPWGFEHPHWFLNQVVILESALPPEQLLALTQSIERRLGRKPKTNEYYQARVIDVDILFYDDIVVEHNDLYIPHPRLHLRRFTLEPLCELMPGFVHPLLQKTMKDLLKGCPDQNEVRKISSQG